MGEMIDRQKVVVVGETGVGKSSILTRYKDNEYRPNIQSTIGVDFFQKKIYLNNATVSINFWDIAGQKKFQSIAKNNFKGSTGVLFVFDLSSKSSFRDLDEWISNVSNDIGSPSLGLYSSILVGNKSDMKRQVSEQEGKNKAKDMGIPYIECSAKDNTNIQKILDTLAQMLVEKYRNSSQLNERNHVIRPIKRPIYDEKQSGCCHKNQ